MGLLLTASVNTLQEAGLKPLENPLLIAGATFWAGFLAKILFFHLLPARRSCTEDDFCLKHCTACKLFHLPQKATLP